MYFFTADEHYGHENIIKFCNRPFKSVEEMDADIIERHNDVVSSNDIVVHVGDFTLSKKNIAIEYLKKLKGNHTFLRGSHDRWLPKSAPYLWQEKIDGQIIVACHYAMRVWPKSHYNSWQIYGHSHGKLEPQGKQWDVGVDINNFYPVSFDQLVEIMKARPDNFNKV